MILSKTCMYALRSITYIGQNSSLQNKRGIKELAENLELPLPYLSKILQRLVKEKIIQSAKGPNGGFYLNEISKEKKIITIIEVIDGLSFFTDCGLGLNECSETHPCPLHNDFKIYRDGLYFMFSEKTIADLISRIDLGDTFIRNPSIMNKKREPL